MAGRVASRLRQTQAFFWNAAAPRAARSQLLFFKCLRRQGGFNNRRKSRSRRGNEAEARLPDRLVFFATKSASLPRRLQFLHTPCFGRTTRRSIARQGRPHSCRFRSNRFGLRREMELFHFQDRRQRGASALRFRTADPLGGSDHLDVSGGEQFENALVEAKVTNRILNPSLLDEP